MGKIYPCPPPPLNPPCPLVYFMTSILDRSIRKIHYFQNTIILRAPISTHFFGGERAPEIRTFCRNYPKSAQNPLFFKNLPNIFENLPPPVIIFRKHKGLNIVHLRQLIRAVLLVRVLRKLQKYYPKGCFLISQFSIFQISDFDGIFYTIRKNLLFELKKIHL